MLRLLLTLRDIRREIYFNTSCYPNERIPYQHKEPMSRIEKRHSEIMHIFTQVLVNPVPDVPPKLDCFRCVDTVTSYPSPAKCVVIWWWYSALREDQGWSLSYRLLTLPHLSCNQNRFLIVVPRICFPALSACLGPHAEPTYTDQLNSFLARSSLGTFFGVFS